MTVILVICRQWYPDANSLGFPLEPGGLSYIGLRADMTLASDVASVS